MQRSKSFATVFTVLTPVYWRQILSTLIIVLFVFNPRYHQKSQRHRYLFEIYESVLFVEKIFIPKLAQWCEPWNNYIERKRRIFFRNNDLYNIHVCLEMDTCSRNSIQILPNWKMRVIGTLRLTTCTYRGFCPKKN